MNTTTELKIRSQLAAADSLDVSPYQGQRRHVAQEYAIDARDIAFELHKAALAGNEYVDFGFPKDAPDFYVIGMMSKAAYLLKQAGLKAPLAVRPVPLRERPVRGRRRDPRGFKTG